MITGWEKEYFKCAAAWLLCRSLARRLCLIHHWPQPDVDHLTLLGGLLGQMDWDREMYTILKERKEFNRAQLL